VKDLNDLVLFHESLDVFNHFGNVSVVCDDQRNTRLWKVGLAQRVNRLFEVVYPLVNHKDKRHGGVCDRMSFTNRFLHSGPFPLPMVFALPIMAMLVFVILNHELDVHVRNGIRRSSWQRRL